MNERAIVLRVCVLVPGESAVTTEQVFEALAPTLEALSGMGLTIEYAVADEDQSDFRKADASEVDIDDFGAEPRGGRPLH